MLEEEEIFYEGDWIRSFVNIFSQYLLKLKKRI